MEDGHPFPRTKGGKPAGMRCRLAVVDSFCRRESDYDILIETARSQHAVSIFSARVEIFHGLSPTKRSRGTALNAATMRAFRGVCDLCSKIAPPQKTMGLKLDAVKK
jgi:hypothetical protein